MRRAGEAGRIPSVSMAEAAFPAPFNWGLEYSAPARGGWTIVHVGMLLPEAHEIFVCPAGCLRGVVLSAAEMNMAGRFSTIAVEEHNVLDGDMEELIIEGVTDILNRLPRLPKAVLVFSSCIHHFMGCDLALCYDELRRRFPNVGFTDCYMIPTMRKSGLTPDQIMRRQLYSLLQPAEKKEKHCALLGNCFSLEEDSDLAVLLRSAGWSLHQITDCRSYEEYQTIAQCSLCISTQPVAKAGAEALAERLHMRHLYLPAGFDAEVIRRNLDLLADALGVPYQADEKAEQSAEAAMREAKSLIGDTPVAIDYTVVPRPLELAALLIRYGFHVTELYTDSFNGEEREDYLWLQKNAPQLTVYPTVHAAMRSYPGHGGEKVLALGQKAAYFTGSRSFVNLVEGGGLYGFNGIRRFAGLMIEAFAAEKDTERLIQSKGLGCESCI